MILFEKGNAAKQWIFEELDKHIGQNNARILDLACGDGHLWKVYLETHSSTHVIGVDFDSKAIERGQKLFTGIDRIDLRICDAQKQIDITNIDAVVAFSSLEHVVDREAFLRTVWSVLKSGGYAFINYDAGHFRSSRLQERLMVSISQILAFFGYQTYYMKRVEDGEILRIAKLFGFEIVNIRKHNIQSLKGFMRKASDEAVQTWYAFESCLGGLYKPEELDRLMLSTTIVLRKP